MDSSVADVLGLANSVQAFLPLKTNAQGSVVCLCRDAFGEGFDMRLGRVGEHVGDERLNDEFQRSQARGDSFFHDCPSEPSTIIRRVLDKRIADHAIERRDEGQVLGLVGHVVGRVDLLAQGRGLGAVVDGFLDRLLHPPLRGSAHADTAGGSQQSNIATGRGGASRGAERDFLSVSHAPPGRPAGWRERGFEWARSRRHSSTSRLFTVGFDVRGREVSQVGPADGGVKLRRVRQLQRCRSQACGRHCVRDGLLDQLHHQNPSLVRRNMKPATNGRTLQSGAIAQ